ncbi:MAG: DUF3791 domain-containing protein [Clostridia bacterium]|nr:DUF3791 domain-containing protein [Clostridia bacterium]
MNRDVFNFVIYMIHACAKKWNRLPSDVYEVLQSCNCIHDYLVPFYDILHTQSSNYVVEDIQDFLKNRGVSL